MILRKTVHDKQQCRVPEWVSGSRAAVFLIAVNVLVHLFFRMSARGAEVFPQLILSPGNIIQGRYWCLLTSGFLHISWAHLALNMLGVFVFGRVVERRLGFRTALFIYFGALFLSMLCSLVIYTAVLQKSVAVLGASGAVMGLMAAAVLIAPFSITWEMLLPLPTMVKGWLFVYADLRGFLGGERDGISHLAHLCGFLSVMVLVYFLSRQDKKIFAAGLVVNLISLAAACWVRMTFL